MSRNNFLAWWLTSPRPPGKIHVHGFHAYFGPRFRPSSQWQDAELFREKTEHESSCTGVWAVHEGGGTNWCPQMCYLKPATTRQRKKRLYFISNDVLFRKSVRKLVWQEATGVRARLPFTQQWLPGSEQTWENEITSVMVCSKESRTLIYLRTTHLTHKMKTHNFLTQIFFRGTQNENFHAAQLWIRQTSN